MPPREPAAYVWDIRDACRTLNEVLAGVGFDEYMSKQIVRLATERLLIVVGEAVASLDKLDPGLAAELGDVSGIVGFRNTLVHGYFKLDHSRVWKVLSEYLPELAKRADAVWARFAPLYPEDSPP